MEGDDEEEFRKRLIAKWPAGTRVYEPTESTLV